MGTFDLPDMYALSPLALDMCIKQIPHAHVTTVTCFTGAAISYTVFGKADLAIFSCFVCMKKAQV